MEVSVFLLMSANANLAGMDQHVTQVQHVCVCVCVHTAGFEAAD